jgi:hypothetical protein
MILGSPKGCLWQKPGNCLVCNCSALKGGAIDVHDIQGFSHIFLIFDTFLDQTHYFKK